MNKKFLAIAVIFFAVTTSFAQLKSPNDFLGYKVGSRYSPHFKIVNYFEQVAANAPSVMKLQRYGETNEGRPLMVAFVSSEENIANLENIRTNNLRLANLSRDKMAPTENTPAIVWLSYNVHGNETSSSEAAMMTLWALIDPANKQTKEWLKNTVVIIDPCMNPDGRDRYVNWFNSVVGKDANPVQMAREHQEPWPGGRSNHYNFDLNRDWAWQTQVESQQRLKLYNQWMPQIHVDYHEQGVNQPYYFAPAAQPFHEAITPWQREFQQIIGKNHAKYFDAKGWLYFTKEVFDLYYPSYGDTYPIYNGAIGFTYEQGGGGGAGAAVLNDEGDTLTLLDRVLHHYTTGLSTIETASFNAGKLVKEFRKFFNDAVSTGVGEYKSFVIKNNPDDHDRIKAFLELMDKNGISYSKGNGSGKGWRYQTGKDESFSLKNDIVISEKQPRSTMVKVLFEPKSKLVDSATYDITAWSMPYVYGLDAYAVREDLSAGAFVASEFSKNEVSDYGYVLPWDGTSAVKFAGKLLQKGALLRYAVQPFELNGTKFDRGAIVILKTANQSLGDHFLETVKKLADESEVKIFPVTTGFVDKGYDLGSGNVHPFRAPRVVLLTGEGVSSLGAGEVWHFMEKQIEYPVTLVNANNMNRLDWNKTDVIVMPDGNYRFLADKTALANFKEWISKGGRVIAIEGAVNGLSQAEFAIKQKKVDADDEKKKVDEYTALKIFGDNERDNISTSTPGSIYRVELDATHPLAFGYPGYYYTMKMDNTVYEFMKDGWNVGVIKKEMAVSGFVGAKMKQRFKDAVLFGVEEMGRGTITYLTDDVLFRNFWENGKLMFCNAVFLVGK